MERQPAGGHPLRRELRVAHRLRLSRRRLPPRRSQEDDQRGHGAVRPHGLGWPAADLLGRLGGFGQSRELDRQRSPGSARLSHRPRARARHLHALQPDPALRLELARRALRHLGAGLRPALRQGPDGHRPGCNRGSGELPAPDLESREPLRRRGAQGRARHPVHRVGQRALASPRGPQGLHRLHQRAHRRRAQHRLREAHLLQRESGFPDRGGDQAQPGTGCDVRVVSHGPQLRPRAGRQLPACGGHVSRHAASRARSTPSHRVRVRQPRPAHGIPVSGDGEDLPRGGRAVRRHVRLRHAGNGLAQSRLADALLEPGLHAAQSDERDHRRRGDAPPGAPAVVRPLSAKHDIRRLPRLTRQQPGGAGRPRRVPVRRLDALGSAGADRAAPRGRVWVVARGDVRRGGHLLPRQGAPRPVAPGGLPRCGARARPVRATEPRQGRDPRDQPRLAHDRQAPGPGERVRGATIERRRSGGGAVRSRSVRRHSRCVRAERERTSGSRDAPRASGPDRVYRVPCSSRRLSATVRPAPGRPRIPCRATRGAAGTRRGSDGTRLGRALHQADRSRVLPRLRDAAGGRLRVRRFRACGGATGGTVRVRHHTLPRRLEGDLADRPRALADGLGLLRPGVLEARRGRRSDAAATVRTRCRRGPHGLHAHRGRGAPRALPADLVRGHGPAGVPLRAARRHERVEPCRLYGVAGRQGEDRGPPWDHRRCRRAARSTARLGVPADPVRDPDGGRRHELDRGAAGRQHVARAGTAPRRVHAWARRPASRGVPRGVELLGRTCSGAGR